MELLEVYKKYEVTPIEGKGAYIYDDQGVEYLDLYGGHAVISIGHSHPHYVARISNQLSKLGFYSNAVDIPLQQELADLLACVSGISGYRFFLCNSGAEANENALKLASFKNKRSKVLALENGFHGRTSAAVRCTHNPKIQAEINKGTAIDYFPMNNLAAIENAIKDRSATAVIVEPIQGVGGCYTCTDAYLQSLEQACKDTGTALILDEVQAGYGRSGDFFAFQKSGITPDIITMAKGMGNGFPIAGVLVHESWIESEYGMLGTTFGGNHLACAAGIAVLEIIQKEDLISNARKMGEYLAQRLNESFSDSTIHGRGLMLGVEFPQSTAELRNALWYQENVCVGSSSNPNIMRVLPPLNINKSQIDHFIASLTNAYQSIKKHQT